MSVAAYKQTIREVENPRDIERRVFSNITYSLEQTGKTFDEAQTRMDRFKALSGGLAEALSENQRFWSTLKHDLATPENGLPPALRASLLSLALWVDRHTGQVLAGAAQVEPLISVNRSVAAGLAGRQAQPQLAEG